MNLDIDSWIQRQSFYFRKRDDARTWISISDGIQKKALSTVGKLREDPIKKKHLRKFLFTFICLTVKNVFKVNICFFYKESSFF